MYYLSLDISILNMFIVFFDLSAGSRMGHLDFSI